MHGHDLNCLAIVAGTGNHRYVSGADEKVARVFEAPGAFLDTLAFTVGGKVTLEDGLIREDVKILGANMSALGLSQKPIYSQGAPFLELSWCPKLYICEEYMVVATDGSVERFRLF